MGYILEAPPERDKVVPLASAPYLSREVLETQARGTLHRSLPTWVSRSVTSKFSLFRCLFTNVMRDCQSREAKAISATFCRIPPAPNMAG